MTLIELLVVLAILALMAGVSVVALRVTRVVTPADNASLAHAREMAIDSGRAVTASVGGDATVPPRRVRFLPDGRALGAGVDPLTGGIGHAR